MIDIPGERRRRSCGHPLPRSAISCVCSRTAHRSAGRPRTRKSRWRRPSFPGISGVSGSPAWARRTYHGGGARVVWPTCDPGATWLWWTCERAPCRPIKFWAAGQRTRVRLRYGVRTKPTTRGCIFCTHIHTAERNCFGIGASRLNQKSAGPAGLGDDRRYG